MCYRVAQPELHLFNGEATLAGFMISGTGYTNAANILESTSFQCIFDAISALPKRIQCNPNILIYCAVVLVWGLHALWKLSEVTSKIY